MKTDSPVTFTPETAAEAWIGLLAMRGVDYLFANGGTDFAPVVEAYAKGQKLGWRLPEIVIVPHENMGIAMAHGYAMVTGRPQAMMVHVGVGTANTLNGLINAARTNIPILLSAGRTPITESGAVLAARNNYIHWAQEHFDQGGMLREFVKWDYELRIPSRSRRFSTARSRSPRASLRVRSMSRSRARFSPRALPKNLRKRPRSRPRRRRRRTRTRWRKPQSCWGLQVDPC
jgi:thiamine pyrophosphate-dependent acetolactate synthase large subunit-like protein